MNDRLLEFLTIRETLSVGDILDVKGLIRFVGYPPDSKECYLYIRGEIINNNKTRSRHIGSLCLQGVVFPRPIISFNGEHFFLKREAEHTRRMLLGLSSRRGYIIELPDGSRLR